MRLQYGEKPSVKLVDEVLDIAAMYQSSDHTGVGDVLPVVERYEKNLEMVDWMQVECGFPFSAHLCLLIEWGC